MSFLLTSPILNPAIIAMFITFFGIKATVVYTILTFLFAVIAGLLLDKFGFDEDMYIRTETMIPIARILIDKGVSHGTMIALIIGGAGASIPELSLLGSIFKKKMMIAFIICIMMVSVITGYVLT